MKLLIFLIAFVVCSCGGGKDSEWDLTLPKKGATDTGQVLKVKRGQAYWDASGEITSTEQYLFIVYSDTTYEIFGDTSKVFRKVSEYVLKNSRPVVFIQDGKDVQWYYPGDTIRITTCSKESTNYGTHIVEKGTITERNGPYPTVPYKITPPKIQQSETLPPIREELHKQNK